MDPTAILILSMLLGLLIYSLIAKWYVLPSLALLSDKQAYTPLLLLHSFRFIGLAFLLTGVVSPHLPHAFAYPAAYGDLLAVALALVALVALRYSWAVALPLIWIFNIVGSIDLLYAISQGAWRFLPNLFGATYFIPVLGVPALLVTHFIIFKLLLRRRVSS